MYTRMRVRGGKGRMGWERLGEKGREWKMKRMEEKFYWLPFPYFLSFFPLKSFLRLYIPPSLEKDERKQVSAPLPSPPPPRDFISPSIPIFDYTYLPSTTGASAGNEDVLPPFLTPPWKMKIWRKQSLSSPPPSSPRGTSYSRNHIFDYTSPPSLPLTSGAGKRGRASSKGKEKRITSLFLRSRGEVEGYIDFCSWDGLGWTGPEKKNGKCE